MKALKWVLVGIGALVVVVGVIVGAVFLATNPAADAANKFLQQVGSGRIEQAYAEAAPLFRQRQKLDDFRRAARRFGIDKYSSASWTNREISGNRTILKGTLTLHGGAQFPAQVGLVKIDGVWRVYGMTFPRGGAGGQDVPPGAELEALVMRSLLDFNEAVRTKDFTAFHAKLSNAMRQKYTAEQIQGVFHRFVEQGIDISGIQNARPSFDPAPRIDRSALAVKGRYPTRPSEVSFDLRYVREFGQWRLTSININVRPVK